MSEAGRSNETSSRNGWEIAAFVVFIATGTLVFVVMGLTFWRYLWHDTQVDIVSKVHTVTNGQHEVIRQDTVLTISTNQYESVLSQVREQNQFLNSLLATLGSSMTIFLAAIGLFTWRMQKKYDTFSGHIKRATEANENLAKKCKEAEQQSDDIVSACSDRIDGHVEVAMEKVRAVSDTASDNLNDKASTALDTLKERIENGVKKIEGRTTWGVTRVTQEAIKGPPSHTPPQASTSSTEALEAMKSSAASTFELLKDLQTDIDRQVLDNLRKFVSTHYKQPDFGQLGMIPPNKRQDEKKKNEDEEKDDKIGKVPPNEPQDEKKANGDGEEDGE